MRGHFLCCGRIPRALSMGLVGGLGFTGAVTASAQETAHALAGRHEIRVGIGFVGVTGSVSASAAEGAQVTSGIQFGSSVGYRYWFREGWAIAADAGLLSMDQEVSASLFSVSVVSSIVGFVSAGVRAQPPSFQLGSRLRPFGELMLGAFSASTSAVEALPPGVEVKDQTVPGLRLGLGLDLPLGSRFLGSLGVYYHLMADFDEPIAGRENFSSLGMELGIGVLLGG